MLHEVAGIQDFVPIDILHKVRYQHDKMIPRLAMLIMAMSSLDDNIVGDLERILLENFSVKEICIQHLNSWILTSKSAKVKSKMKQYLGKDAASIIRGEKNLEEAIFRASRSICNIKFSVMYRLKKELDCKEFQICKELQIAKFMQELEFIMTTSVKNDQYCSIEIAKLFKMVVSRLVFFIRSKFTDTSCED